MAKCRLYIDESGTHDYTTREAVDKRYLCITGVMIPEQEVVDNLTPKLRALKYLVTGDHDEVITLHRREIANRTGVYSKLRDSEIEKAWNIQVMDILKNVDYTICTVVLDKKSHKEKYTSPMNPYHYCLYILVEKYVQLLEKTRHRGDVLAESRGKIEDGQLESAFTNVCNVGTSFVSRERFDAVLTSKKLKFKPKMAIPGLELADLVVMASKLDVLVVNDRITAINSTFTKQIINTIQTKYYKNPYNGWIKGYGKKFLG